MARILLLAAIGLFAVLALRRAFGDSEALQRRRLHRRRRGRPALPPHDMVCGTCGQRFDPDQTGWICPMCGR